MEILNKIKESPFIYPKKKYYLGKIQFGTPYFNPINFKSDIISIKKLIPESIENLMGYKNKYSHIYKIPNHKKYTNYPQFSRCKKYIFKLFKKEFILEIGWPIMFKINNLGWKDKYDSPRFEWNPSFQIFFFKYQFCVWWVSPFENDLNDNYWEQILWYFYYNDSNMEETIKNWPWVSNGVSTWNNKILK